MSSREEKALTAALVGTGGLVAVPGLIAAPMLGLLGFGSLGPGAGTVAALIQSLIGNITAASLFAMLQSAGMGGAGALALGTLLSGFGIGIAGIVGITGLGLVGLALYKFLKAFFRRKRDEDGADEDEGNDDAKDGDKDSCDAEWIEAGRL
ncbi:hypothetical protein E4U09_003232 [Claviceps aff. purpurea]|uniref:Uncharacterized protein n=1 Tax=Claviceps aff. purpurea TaxID=1967640 RepID=A0A9P7QER1_9HYPO|nr:hypothetical protein E4U09_003232 [Claviceps aff. purpurea]